MNSRFGSVAKPGFVVLAIGIFATACIHSSKDQDPSRSIAGEYAYKDMYMDKGTASPKTLEVLKKDVEAYGGNIQFTSGLNGQEAADLWHLSEGSDVFPLAWFRLIRSGFNPFKDNSRLYEAIDKKYGVIAEPPSISKIHDYATKGWVGLTASWSGEHPAKSDVRLKPGQTIEDVLGFRRLPNGEASIAMVGVNCAFCHTNEINMNGRVRIQEGAPNMLNIRGFFQDMFASTAKTMLTKELLADFLREAKVPGDHEKIAKEFSNNFYNELELGRIAKIIGPVIEYINPKKYNDTKQRKLKAAFFEKHDVVKKYLIKLLALTYGIKENEVPVELQMRMEWLAKSLGVDPNLKVTPEGYSRTDAFGRIANWVARVDEPISLDATVSLPPMWGIQYKSLFHWNANTNSVVMRNMGQSFGLGSILLYPKAKDDTKWISTSNLYNLHRIEDLLYKLHTPQWQDFAANNVKTEVDIRKAVEGCNTFHKVCAGCHMPDKERVGPQQKLVNYKVLPLKKVGTDSTYTMNQKTPVNGTPFKDALFHFTGKTRDSFYKRFNITEEEKAIWERRDLRGPEKFRDTYLGESGHPEVTKYMNIPAQPSPGYVARHLGGAWATAPYLHNGSVPTVWDLLQPAARRPKVFFLGSRVYDTKKLGFDSSMSALVSRAGVAELAQQILAETKKGKRTGALAANTLEAATVRAACEIYPANCFDINFTGNSNKGHEFGVNLTDEQKWQLIEFIKIIRPDPEYSRRLDPLYVYDAESKTCSAVE